MNIPLTPLRFLRYAEQQYPCRTAVVCNQENFTYGQFADRARRLAGALHQAGVQPGDPFVQRRSVIETEPAVWSAHSDTKAAFGFASFDVAPVEAGGTTSITVTYWAASDGSPSYRARDRVVLRKPLRAGQWSDDQLAGTRQARRSSG